MSDLIEIAALWENRTQDGEVYYSGRLNNAKLLVFRNKHKSAPKHPDFKVLVAPPSRPRGDTRSADNQPPEEDIMF